MNGVIKKMVRDKHFGFITIEGQEKDLFFHGNSVIEEGGFDALNEGDMVTFEEADSPKGKNAINVKKAGAEA